MRNYYNKFRGIALLCFFTISFIGNYWGQVSAYNFTQSSGTYTPITGGSVLHTGTTDDAISASTALGFTFNYNGVDYTTIKVNSNGWASFGTTTTGGTYTPLSTTGTHHPCITPLGRDLQGNTLGEVRIETSGLAPNRVCTIQWKDYRRFAGAGQNFNFQIKLYETTNIVQFVYGTMITTALNSDYDCGITGTTNTDFNIRTTTTDWAATTAGATNAANMSLSTTVFPASGQTYTWISCPSVAPSVTNASICVGTTADITATPTVGGTINWYDAATGGNLVGTGNTFTTPVLATNTSYYATETFASCPETAASESVVSVDPVVVTLDPVNITCNGNLTGSFVQSTTACGTAPFSYSIDGGPFDVIPTDMAAGTYSIVVMDVTMAVSSPISLTITEPSSPYNITFNNVGYYSADVTWMSDGIETSWDVEIGPAGFTPGTGITQTVSVMTASFSGLMEDTDYDVYITPACSGNETPGQAVLSTNQGFFTYDNACGPGFIDITSTGTALNLADDASTTITTVNPVSVNGNTSNTITVSNNGFISFGGATLNVWNNDWDAETGNVYWEETTIGGDNYLIVEWFDRPRFSGVIGQSVTFEVLVNQTTGEVYYIYDDVVVGGTQASNDFGGQGTISALTTTGTITVSSSNTAYLTNNSCVHFYYALCPNPVITSVQTFQEDIILDWAAGPYGESEWTIIYGPAGFDPMTEGTTEGGITTSDFTISGLTQITEYDIYIYSECALDNLTSGGLLVEATTLPWCNTPTALAGTTVVDSLFATWNWTPVAGATNGLTSFNIQYGNSGFDLYNGTLEVATDIDFADTVANPAFLAGGVYQVYVQAVCGVDTSSYAGPYSFVMPLSNDTVCGAEMLSVDGTVYTFNNAGATVSIDENTIAPPTTGANSETGWINSTLNNTTWFTFVAPASGNVRVNNTAINYSGQAAVYDATDCADFASFTLMGANDNSMLSVSNAPNFSVCGLTPGNVYYLMNDGNSATTGNYSISITPIVLEAGSFTNILDVCTGSEVNLFDGIAGNDQDGVWSAEIAAAGTGLVDSVFNSTGLAYQIFNFEYRMTDGCAYDSIIAQVEIWAPSSAGTDGSIDVCRNEPFDLLSGLGGNVDMGGTWYNPSAVAMPSSATTSSNIPGQFNYNYITGNGVCPDDTALVLVNVSSTCNYLDVEEMFFGDMTVFPNPSNGVFNIANEGSSEVFNYEVTDIEGRVIATKDAAINGTSTTEIDLTGKVTGVYMIRVYNDNAEKVFRVVLQ